LKILATKLCLLSTRSTKCCPVESCKTVRSEYDFRGLCRLSHESFITYSMPKKIWQNTSPRLAGLGLSACPTPSPLKATSDLNNCLLSQSPLRPSNCSLTPCNYTKRQVKTSLPGHSDLLALLGNDSTTQKGNYVCDLFVITATEQVESKKSPWCWHTE